MYGAVRGEALSDAERQRIPGAWVVFGGGGFGRAARDYGGP